MNIETKGGVSPLKAKRGGKHADAATSKKGGWLKGRGGYAESGTGSGENPGGYNIHTRFSPRKTPTAPKVGSGTTKPYSYDKDGNLVVNKASKSGTPGYWTYKDLVTEHEYDNLESYQKVWDRNDKKVQDKYETIDDFIKAGKEWWESDEGKAEKERRKKGKITTTERVKDKWIPGTGSYAGVTESK